ncbi:MAG TPA: MFS transporter, partial [Solirubrobacteraceae bacterium]|nr:MFS transporter [Solirubrobacteraceae bacterium]
MPTARLTVSIGPVRWALLALALGGFGIGTGEFVSLGLLPNIAGSLHVSIPQAGHLISAYALGVVVGAPLLTGAAVRLPRRRLLIVVVLTMAALNVASAMAVVFAGLTVANVIGVPATTLIGQHTSWRVVFVLVA